MIKSIKLHMRSNYYFKIAKFYSKQNSNQLSKSREEAYRTYNINNVHNISSLIHKILYFICFVIEPLGYSPLSTLLICFYGLLLREVQSLAAALPIKAYQDSFSAKGNTSSCLYYSEFFKSFNTAAVMLKSQMIDYVSFLSGKYALAHF